jgi:hypothetical protein
VSIFGENHECPAVKAMGNRSLDDEHCLNVLMVDDNRDE